MADPRRAASIIIKRKKVVAGGGHHGGAWKVAYADFVTAMMAFFLLMWLLNATTENQRKGIADYFKTTIPLVRISGGGDGSLQGDNVMAEDVMAQSGEGALAPEADPALTGALPGGATSGDAAGEQRRLEEVAEKLRAFTGDSMKLEQLMRHVSTRITEEGLVVELFDLEGAPLFAADSALPEPILRDLIGMVGEVFSIVANQVAINAHVKAYPITMIDNPAWQLSADRADAIRDAFGATALPAARIERLSGFADRRPAVADPMAVRNNRVEIVLLRKRS
jgi:chemotaxis protein MotB